MALTRTAVRTRVRTFIAEPSAKNITDAEINSWIDDACRDISMRTLSNEVLCTAIVTVSGTRAYAIPTEETSTGTIETIAVKTVINSAGTSLLNTMPDMLGRHGGEGLSMEWTEWGDNIILTPTPTAVYSLEMLVWTIVGCTAAGTLSIDAKYHHVVPYYCLSEALIKKREYEAAAAAFQLYVNHLSPDKPPHEKITEAHQSPQD